MATRAEEEMDALVASTSSISLVSSSQHLTLQTLLPELQIHLFKFLGPVSSVCLGLTCKKFYGIHQELNGATPIDSSEEIDRGPHGTTVQLHLFLRPWMWNGAALIWGGRYGLKFIVPERRIAGEEEFEEAKDRVKRATETLNRAIVREENPSAYMPRGWESTAQASRYPYLPTLMALIDVCNARQALRDEEHWERTLFNLTVSDADDRCQLQLLGQHDPGWQGIFEAELLEAKDENSPETSSESRRKLALK